MGPEKEMARVLDRAKSTTKRRREEHVVLGGDNLKKSHWPLVTIDLYGWAALICFNTGNARSVPVFPTR